ncbi:LPS-assembly protein [Amphritea atlantica]|uniref:LPS-assembly protein LptD n=1 Tax=Amphritea atlantica TaxID=355243 RepID=A0A1H9M7F3_9GAMM|nr:LPS assembly protein LptD [Amphritea atlantica]SER19680.1 LPS-assembly protein [Amphritea atlantica]
MPFSRRSSYTLTLAIIAAMPAVLLAAETDSGIRDALWTCTMENGQNWQCDQPDRTNPLADQDKGQLQEAPAEALPVTDNAADTATPDPAYQQQISGAWLCEANASGGWSCLDNQPTTGGAAEQSSRTSVAAPGNADSLSSDDPAAKTKTQNADLSDIRYAEQDWYPITGASKACYGVYIEPDSQLPAEDDDSLTVDADSSETQLGGLTRLEGNVELRQRGHFLRSDSAEVDQISNQITMNGNIQYREPGLLLRGSKAQTNAISGETVVSDADYVVHERSLRGEAKRIIRLKDNRIRMEHSSYTTCPPNDESWKIASSSLVLDPNRGFGTARNATLKVADTPVFYFPYIEFPIDDLRHSGFLFPSLGYSNEDGLELAAPYYFNLAPNYDDTLTPKVFTERGLLLENEFRHLNHYGKQTLSTGLLIDDTQADRDRWLVGIDHTGSLGAWSSLVDYTAVSDKKYFDDLGSSLAVDRSTHLDQRAETTYTREHWSATLRAHSYQTINDSKSPYQRMPQLQVSGNYGYQLGQEVVFSYLTDMTRFERKIDDLSGIDRVTGSRLHIQPAISLPMLWSWGYLTPKMSYWLSHYDLQDQVAGQDDSIDRATGVFSIDSGLVFERQLDNYTQTVEPRLFTLYSQRQDQQGIPDFDTAETDFSYQGLFRENRFTGFDKVSDNQQISVGLSSGFFTSDGSEIARVGLAQAYYFADRTVQLNGDTSVDTEDQSNYAAEAYWNPYSELRLSVDTELDRSGFNPLESNFKVRYTPSLNKVIGFSYRYRENVRSQAELSFIWPLAPEWTLMGRWQEDMEHSQTPEALLGLEYASCCWKVRVAARKWIEDDSGGREDSALFLQFILKGLGTVGGGTSVLQDIIGFKEREENDDY